MALVEHVIPWCLLSCFSLRCTYIMEMMAHPAASLPSSPPSFQEKEVDMLEASPSSQEERVAAENLSFLFDSQHMSSPEASVDSSSFPVFSKPARNGVSASSPLSPFPSCSSRLPVPCPGKFPWDDLSRLCEECEAHLVILQSLQNQGFPACFSFPSSSSSSSSSSPDLFFTLNFSSLHALTLFATSTAIRGTALGDGRGAEPLELSREGEDVQSFLGKRGGGRGGPEEERGKDSCPFGTAGGGREGLSLFQSDFLQAGRRGGRPREVLYSFQGGEGERKAKGRRPVSISWRVVDFVVKKLRAVRMGSRGGSSSPY